MEKSALEKKIWRIIEPVTAKLELEIVDVKFVQDGGYYYVRIFIEKKDYNLDVNFDECEKVSREVEDDIDRIIKEKFFLEVSSPGLERELIKEEDFHRFSGEKIKVLLKHKINGSRNIIGVLENFENDQILLIIEKEKVLIPFSEIKKANLVFEF